MTLDFYKYHGAGNDFIILDGRSLALPKKEEAREKLFSDICHRRYGIGADGIIIYRESEAADFIMEYYNADGKLGSMCGNGARCIVHWAYSQALINVETHFKAYDGIHKATVLENDQISVEMFSNGELKKIEGDYLVDTGSPHFIRSVNDLESMDVYAEGKRIRYSKNYKAEGINVNFIEDHSDCIHMRTYERGVEDETLACGTGTVAVAIVARNYMASWSEADRIPIKALGGDLTVSFMKDAVYLMGPARLVFRGSIDA